MDKEEPKATEERTTAVVLVARPCVASLSSDDLGSAFGLAVGRFSAETPKDVSGGREE